MIKHWWERRKKGNQSTGMEQPQGEGTTGNSAWKEADKATERPLGKASHWHNCVYC